MDVEEEVVAYLSNDDIVKYPTAPHP